MASSPLLVFLVVFWLVGSRRCVRGGSIDPYAVLSVSQTASQAEIRSKYRRLCLKLHPDKNVGKSLSERKASETRFKEVQEAYSLIGSPNARSRHDRNPNAAFPSSKRSNPFGPTQAFQAMHRASSASGVPYGQGFAFRQSRSRGFYFFQPPPTSVFADAFQAMGLGVFRSHFQQRVCVPLESLYKGQKGFKFKLHHNIWARYRAAARGRAIFVNLYQAFAYSLPLLRISPLVALGTATAIFHFSLPSPSTTDYVVDLKAGLKGGKTRIRFPSQTFEQPEVTFILEESQHPRFKRVGNDLYATVKISRKDAMSGCRVKIEPLDKGEDYITFMIEPNQVKSSGEMIRIPGRGWPVNSKATDVSLNQHGDLVVRVLIKKRVFSYRKSQSRASKP